MNRTFRRTLAALVLAVAVTMIAPAAPAAAVDSPYKVLVFSKTAGFRHDSIPAGIQLVRDLGAANNFTVDATEDAATFTAANLAQYAAVIFLSTTGDVLNDTQQAAFESYVGSGGGYVGVHAAADTEYTWPFYGQLMGAWFASHPAIQSVTVRTEDRAHAASAGLPQAWVRSDELYNYQTNPRANVHVLSTLDESTYSGGTMGADHPITWCHPYAGGRAFYTGLGHTQESYAEANFRNVVLGGIRYAAGRAKADCRPETGYTNVYNGSVTGWTQSGPGSFTNTDATLTTVGGLGLLWYSARKFGSYSLKADWKLTGDANSGIYVGIPTGTDPVNDAINRGYEIQIDATDVANATTGAIYGFQAANQAARDGALNPPGAWNTFEIIVTGQNIQVYLNGVKINDFTNTDPNRDISSGYIGLQNHSAADTVQFRHVRVKESGAPAGAVEAETFSAQNGGVQVVNHTNASGGRTVGFIDNGDWIGFGSVNVAGANRFTARVASAGAGGTIGVRSGSATGPVLGSVAVPVTGSWETFTSVSTTLTAGSGPLYLVFTGGAGALFDVDTVSLTTGATTPVLLSQGRPATASSTENTTLTPANAVDGNTTTRWSSAFTDPQWLQIDLGTTHTINRVVLTWEAAYGKNYQIQTSNDTTTWTTIATTTNGDGATDDLTVTGTGRYIRMNGTARGTAWGYSLFEFGVYGT